MNTTQPDTMLSADGACDALETDNAINQVFFGQEVPATLILPDGRFTSIGHGINAITASGPNTESLKSSLLKREVYGSLDYIDCSRINLAESGSDVSDKFEEVFKSVEIEASVKTGGKFAFFTGGISAKYGMSGKLSENAKFYNAIASVETEKQSLNSEYIFGKNMRVLVNPNVLKNINDQRIDPGEIFDIYGTHIITSASNGGCIQVHGIYNSSEAISNQQFQAAVDFLCSFISVNANTKFTEEHKTILSSTSVKAKSYGGDVSVVAGMHSFTEIGESFVTWAKSIRDNNNQALAKIYDYMPIWELADEERRQEELKTAFVELASKNCNDISKYFQTLPAEKAVALESMVPYILGIYPVLAHIMLQPGGTGFKTDLVRVSDGPIDEYSIFDMIFNPDDTVSFRAKTTKKFLSVHYNSVNAAGDGHGDVSQLFANGSGIDKRQKFILEPFETKYRIKSLFNQRYIGSHSINNKNNPIPNQADICLFADQDSTHALLFELKEL